MRWDKESDKYVPVAWEDAFAEIGRELVALGQTPDASVFYTSGRASLEACYMYQLFARLYGTNNLPDSSNMCHESTSVALPESIGVAVGTVTLQDFEQADLMLYVGHNPGTSAPRILHQLQSAAKRGATIIGINPLRERGLERFKNPQNPIEMLTPRETEISDDILQVRNGGDIALLTGVCKLLIEWDDALAAQGEAHATDRETLLQETDNDAGFSIKAAAAGAQNRRMLDHDFIDTHTHGFEPFAAYCRDADWGDITRVSGLGRDVIEGLAKTYSESNAAMAIYGMGLTQHVAGVENVQMLINLLLLRGQYRQAGRGRLPGARPLQRPGPAHRGHHRKAGAGAPRRAEGDVRFQTAASKGPDDSRRLREDDLRRGAGFRRPRRQLLPRRAGPRAGGGGLAQAAPHRRHRHQAQPQPRGARRGGLSAALPWPDRDRRAGDGGPQAVSMESSLAHFHGSKGQVKPAGPRHPLRAGHHRRHRQGHADAQPQSPVGRMGWATIPRCATGSSRPGPPP